MLISNTQEITQTGNDNCFANKLLKGIVVKRNLNFITE